MKLIIYILILCIIQNAISQNATLHDYERLLDDFIKPYSNLVRPLANQSRAIDVYITISFLNLLEINEVQQQIQLNAWFNFSWHDEIRRWDPSDYGGIEFIHTDPVDIWRPRVIISNSVGERDVFKDNYAATAIFSTGASRWYPGTIFSLSCKLDMTYFPFDRQNCSLRLLGNYYRGSVFLQFSKAAFRAGGYIANGEWEFLAHHTLEEDIVFREEVFRRLTLYLVFERRPQFYVINILIPVMFMSFLSFFAFIIPKDSGERCSFAITVLLSLAVYMTIISGQIPPNSDTFPIIVNYIFGLLLLSGTSVISVVIHYKFITERPQTNSQHTDGGSGKDCACFRSYTEITNVSFGPSSQAKPLARPNHRRLDPATTSLSSLTDSNNGDPKEEVDKCRQRAGVDDQSTNTNLKDKMLGVLRTFLKLVLHIEGIVLFLLFVSVWVFLTAYFIPQLVSNTR